MARRWPLLLAGLALGALAAGPGPAPASREQEPPDAGPPGAEREALADQKRDESIELLRRLLQRLGEGAPERAEMYFQLAELTAQCAVYCAQSEPACAAFASLEGTFCMDRDIGHRWGAICHCG